YTKDLGKCRLCGGSGRLKGELPKIKCPACGGSKELNAYVAVTHPLVLGLEPGLMAACNVPPLGFHQGEMTIEFRNRELAQSYVRHMTLGCMAFEPAVPDPALLVAAKDSNHPWAVALRAAMGSTVCPACHGHGKLFVMAPEAVVGGHGPAPKIVVKRHDLGAC